MVSGLSRMVYSHLFRLLGKFTEAAKDLSTACRIDFDETADEWLKEVSKLNTWHFN